MKKLKNLYKNSYLKKLYPFLLGAISSFSLPPYNYFIINFFTFSLLLIFIVKQRDIIKNKFIYFKHGWAFGFGYFALSLYWISIALTFDSSLKILIPISLILIPSFLGIFYGLAIYIFSYFIKKNDISLILIFSLIFAVIEFIRGFIFTGFPWNLFAFSFSKNLQFIQILSVVGTYGFNMICITFFLIPSIIFLGKTKKHIFTILSSLLMMILFLVYGNFHIKKSNSSIYVKNDFMIKVLSSNINIDRFYNVTNEEKIIEDLISLSMPDKEVSTIFIWPEGIFTSTDVKDIKKYKDLFAKNFSKKHFIVLGINETILKNEDEKIYNSLAVFGNNLELIDIYYKNNLVPFGEFLPFENYLKKIGLRSITHGYQSFSRGETRKTIKLQNDYFDFNFLPLICYEIIYSGNLYKESDFDFIINISEDGWFGNSIGPHQHFAHSIFRAIEEGKNIIRSTNNGSSVYMDVNGKILDQLKSTQSGVIQIDSHLKSKNTIFLRQGNKMFFYLLLIYISFIFFINRKDTV